MTRRLLITGRPGVGKSTLFARIVEELKGLGCRVAGFAAPEAREHGRRVGFLIVDLETGERGWLARVEGCHGPRVGRYRVCTGDALRIGLRALERALEADVAGIDEVGPMELALSELRAGILRLASSGKPLVAVVHARLRTRDPAVYRALARDAWVVELAIDNREEHAARAAEYAGRIALEAGCPGRGL